LEGAGARIIEGVEGAVLEIEAVSGEEGATEGDAEGGTRAGEDHRGLTRASSHPRLWTLCGTATASAPETASATATASGSASVPAPASATASDSGDAARWSSGRPA
jgi:hypothetical protein